MLSSQSPIVWLRPGPLPFDRWGISFPQEVADYSEDKRPAFRVQCHCRNCSWKGQARFAAGEKIPLWLRCPKCETIELSAHGGFEGRDELGREQEWDDHRAALARIAEKRKEMDKRVSR